MKLILASQSSRRRELLAMIAPQPFTVQVSETDETLPEEIDPARAVMLLAEKKARAVAGAQENADAVVIGADTVVVIDGKILGKPRSRSECEEMLGLLSGRVHTVYTGVSVLAAGEAHSFFQSTEVEFYPLSGPEIAWYASLEEPYDKAGAYGIQGRGAVLIKGIRGDYFNVMGLPVAKLWRTLRELGLKLE